MTSQAFLWTPRTAVPEILNPRLPREFVSHVPTIKQRIFLCALILEGLYGGAAGGGKSDALLMGALQYVHIPGYAAILFRRTYADLALPEALMTRSHEWLGNTVARWREVTKTWHFPSGATLTFGYLQNERDKYRYQSSAFQFIGFDELTQFSSTQYTYLFSRLRRSIALRGIVPLRMRSASNPGGVGHNWVKTRFIDNKENPDRLFFPAGLKDNPFLDAVEYIRSLMNLDPVTRAQLLDGDWTVRPAGGKFKREWYSLVPSFAQDRDHDEETRSDDVIAMVRFWDMASTTPKEGTDPDWTVGVLMGRTSNGKYVLIDVRRFREDPAGNERFIGEVAQQDQARYGPVAIRMELEPGSAGLIAIDSYARGVLQGFDFVGIPSTGDKELRANPVSAAAYNGNIRVIEGGAWLDDYWEELEAFPQPEGGVHDDQVDATSGAFAFLNEDEFLMHI